MIRGSHICWTRAYFRQEHHPLICRWTLAVQVSYRFSSSRFFERATCACSTWISNRFLARNSTWFVLLGGVLVVHQLAMLKCVCASLNTIWESLVYDKNHCSNPPVLTGRLPFSRCTSRPPVWFSNLPFSQNFKLKFKDQFVILDNSPVFGEQASSWRISH